jgi:arginine/lysine/ornithine decarboxylase
MTLLEHLKTYTGTMLPMHMPGGKRRFASDLPYAWDVTEVEGTDDLHDPCGILAEVQRRAAALWGAQRSFLLVNGSTGGILSAVRATGEGELLMGRNCHKSVYNAAALCRRNTHYILPVEEEILPADLASALDAHPAVTTVVITSPTYHGVISDIAALADICHSRGVTLLVDEAHGAHLGFSFGESSVKLGADIVIQSLHKTLPALTQTAVLHCKERFASAIARENAVFETSSPSYILMASADECFAFLSSTSGKQAMEAYKENLLTVREKLRKSLQNFRLMESPRYDMGKLVILTHGTSCTGRELADRLRTDYRIETEMSLPHSLTAMTSPCDTEKELNAFADAVLEIDKTVHTAQTPVLPAASPPKQVYPAYAVYGKEGSCLPIEEAVGKISLSYLWAYPPGIPLLVPGEQVEEPLLHTVKQYENAGIPLHGMEKGLQCMEE